MNSQAVKLRDYVSGAFDENVRFKKYRELWKEVECCNTLTDYPMMLDIELSGICNLKCEECFQNGSIEGKLGFMERTLFKKIIDEGSSKGLCSIKLQVRGESFLHPYWCECCCYAKEAGIMDIQITTNGALLDEANIQQILDSDLDGIVFSVDSHHGDSWEKIKNGEKYESSVKNNIKKFLERRKQLNKGPWVRIQTSLPVVNDNTYSEAKDFFYKIFPGVDADLLPKN